VYIVLYHILYNKSNHRNIHYQPVKIVSVFLEQETEDNLLNTNAKCEVLFSK